METHSCKLNFDQSRKAPALPFGHSPIGDIELYLAPAERVGVQRMLGYAMAGSPAPVREGLREFIAQTQADELMVTTHIYDPAVAQRSPEITAQVRGRL